MNRTSSLVPENYLESRSFGTVTIETILLVIMNLLSLFGNSLVCAAIYRSPALRTETNLLLVTLAVSDILMASIAMPLTEAAIVSGTWQTGEIACQIQGYCVCMLAFFSLQLMTLTAFNRYVKVVRPERYKKLFTKRKTLAMILAVSVTSAGVIAILLFIRSSGRAFIFHPGKAICVPVFETLEYSQIFTSIYAVLFVVCPAALISFCYAKILQTIKYNKDEYSATRGTHDSKSVLEREDKKLTRIVLAIILGFAACWLPCIIIDFVDINIKGFLPREVYLTYTFLGFTSSLINPILYGIMNKFIRREAVNILSCRKRNRSGRSTWTPASTAICGNLTVGIGSRETLKIMESNLNLFALDNVELQNLKINLLKR